MEAADAPHVGENADNRTRLRNIGLSIKEALLKIRERSETMVLAVVGQCQFR